MTLDLTEAEAAALAKHLRQSLDEAPSPLAPGLAPLKSILDKLDPPPLRPGMATPARGWVAMKLPSALRRPHAFWLSVCNMVGLLFNMVGVWLLFCYALPNEPPASPEPMTKSYDRAPYEAQMRRFQGFAYTGLTLVLIGTFLEGVPPFCTVFGISQRGSGEKQK